MIRRMFSLLVLLVWAGIPVYSKVSDNLTMFQLDNGMQVVVIEDHRAPIANHMIWLRVGAVDDPPGKSGLAHFLEHLMFKGTEEVESGEYDRQITLLGGSNNAGTSQDYSFYWARVATDFLEEVMILEADRLQNLIIAPEEVDAELSVILEERNQRVDSDPSALFAEQMTAALFLHHPHGKPVIGWRHEMEGLSRADAIEFYRDYYAPNNAILVVSGDVDPEDVFAMASEHYGKLAPAENLKQRVTKSEPPHLAERRMTLSDPRVSNPVLIRRYLAPNDYSNDIERAAAIAVLAEVLGNGSITAVLGRELQLEQEIAVYAGAGYRRTPNGPSILSLYAVPAEGVSLEELEKGLDVVLEEFIQEGVESEHLERIKAQVRYGEIYRLDSSFDMAMDFGRGLTLGLTVEQIDGWLDEIEKVDKDDVMEVARLLTERDRSVTGWLMTEETE